MRVTGILFLVVFSSVFAQNFSEFPRAKQVVETLVTEHGFDRDVVEGWMASGEYRPSSIKKLAAPTETNVSYARYKPLFVASQTIRLGKDFMATQRDLLAKAEREYGVPAEIITAIIGVESRYGRSKGRHLTFDSLASLAVAEGRRADYFQREWLKFILIADQQGMNPVKVKGSYAGATGYPQFMPSSYEAYAVDHDDDGDIDIWSDPFDAIGSVANYLKMNGWKKGEPIVSPVVLSGDYEAFKLNSFDRDRTLIQAEKSGWTPEIRQDDGDLVFPIRLDGKDGAEYWLGYKNFWVISRYNRSISYSMAVFQLSEAFAQ